MARDIAIRFDGVSGTVFDFDRDVSGKGAEEQRYIINTATDKGSDRLYPSRGTDLMDGVLHGMVVDYNSAAHLGNFAALDTTSFMGAVGPSSRMLHDDAVYLMSVVPLSYTNSSRLLNYTVSFTFRDGSATSTSVTINDHHI